MSTPTDPRQKVSDFFKLRAAQGVTVPPSYFWTGRRLASLTYKECQEILDCGGISTDIRIRLQNEHGAPEPGKSYAPRNRARGGKSPNVYQPNEGEAIKSTRTQEDIEAQVDEISASFAARQVTTGSNTTYTEDRRAHAWREVPTTNDTQKENTPMSTTDRLTTPDAPIVTMTPAELATLTPDRAQAIFLPFAPTVYKAFTGPVNGELDLGRVDTVLTQVGESISAPFKDGAGFPLWTPETIKNALAVTMNARRAWIEQHHPRPTAPQEPELGATDEDLQRFAEEVAAYQPKANEYRAKGLEYNTANKNALAYAEAYSSAYNEARAVMEAREQEARALAEAEEARAGIASSMTKFMSQIAAHATARRTKTPIPGVECPAHRPEYQPSPLLRKLAHGLLIDMSNRHKATNVLCVGPAGAGKTVFAEQFAALAQLDYLPIETYLYRESQDIFGRYTIEEGRPVWEDSPFVTLLERGFCVITLEELSRAPAEVLNAYLPLLDHRRAVYVPQAKRTVKVGPCVFFFSSANIGSAYLGAGGIDLALDTRFGARVEVSYLQEDELTSIMTRQFLPGAKVKEGTEIPFAIDWTSNPYHGISPAIIAALSGTVRATANAEEKGFGNSTIDRALSPRELQDAILWYSLIGPDSFAFTLLSRFPVGAPGQSSPREEVLNLINAQLQKHVK